MRTLADRLGCTEGQLYTAVIGLVVAVALAVTAIPSVLGSHAAPPPPTVTHTGATR